MIRDLLAFFHNVYPFVQSHYYYTPCALWPSVREELRAFNGLMIFVVSRWTSPWSPIVYAVDASLSGYGIRRAEWGSKCAGEVGRVREKTRRALGAERARHESLEAADFAVGKDGKTIKDLKGNFAKLIADVVGRIRGERWEVDKQFPEVPSSLLNDDLWSGVLKGPWYFKDAIHNLEART